MAGGVGMSLAEGTTMDVLIGVRVTSDGATVVQEPAIPVSRRHRPITRDEAKVLTDRIRIALGAVWQLLETAYVDRAWSAMGYESWDRYCAMEFGESRIPIPKEDRETVVKSLRSAGLSYRAIASATDMSKSTAKNLDSAPRNRTPTAEKVVPELEPRSSRDDDSGVQNWTPDSGGTPSDASKAGSTVQNWTVDEDPGAPDGMAEPQMTLGVDGKWRPSKKPCLAPAPADPIVIDGSVVEDEDEDEDDLIECDLCGEGHPPEVAVCPYLVVAEQGRTDVDREYRLPIDSVESTGEAAADLDANADAEWEAMFEGMPAGLLGLRAVAMGVKHVVDIRDDLGELPRVAASMSAGLDAILADGDVQIPDEEFVSEIRSSVAGIRAQLESLESTLAVWDALASRIEGIRW